MDNDRPSLDLKYFEDICPDKNGMSQHSSMNWDWPRGFIQVPVIAVFTKYDQFRRQVRMELEDEGRDEGVSLVAEVERLFNERYLSNLPGSAPFVRLESEGIYQLPLTALIPMPRRNA
jgi:hypothetical protein